MHLRMRAQIVFMNETFFIPFITWHHRRLLQLHFDWRLGAVEAELIHTNRRTLHVNTDNRPIC